MLVILPLEQIMNMALITYDHLSKGMLIKQATMSHAIIDEVGGILIDGSYALNYFWTS